MSCGHFYVPGGCVFIMAFLRCCVPSLQEAVTAEGLAVARSTYTVAFCCWLSWLVLLREETSLWQERAHFVGLYQLCWLISAMHRKLRQRMVNSDCKTGQAAAAMHPKQVPPTNPLLNHQFLPDDLILIPEINSSHSSRKANRPM